MDNNFEKARTALSELETRGSCGCGQVFCCGMCVPEELMAQLKAKYDNLEVHRCSSDCSCGGIPVIPDELPDPSSTGEVNDRKDVDP